MSKRALTRRRAVAGLAVTVAAAAAPLSARIGSSLPAHASSAAGADRGRGLAMPPACTPGTLAQTEGPFYTPSTPHRANLREPDSRGEPLVLRGLVLTPDCRPLSGAAIDLWHCDERGRYDNVGFRYRGHQFADEAGAFRFETIRPGRYPARTPHFHVKVQGETTGGLTTQLYFPDLPRDNAGDAIYRDELLLHLRRVGDTWRARFDFVLSPA